MPLFPFINSPVCSSIKTVPERNLLGILLLSGGRDNFTTCRNTSNNSIKFPKSNNEKNISQNIKGCL